VDAVRDGYEYMIDISDNRERIDRVNSLLELASNIMIVVGAKQWMDGECSSTKVDVEVKA
jgi:hypothetical protein